MQFEYCMPTRVICGADNIKKLDELMPNGPVFIVSDRIMVRIGVTERMKEILAPRRVEVFAEVEPNPSFETADKAAAIARKIGAIGVIGPTRLNYARVIPLVDYTARVLGRLLES